MKTVVIEIEMEIDETQHNNCAVAEGIRQMFMRCEELGEPNYVICRDKYRRHNPADSSTARPDHSS